MKKKKSKEKEITMYDILVALGVEKYEERIINSNSRGELFFLMDYALLYKYFKGDPWFPKVFDAIVKYAEDNWERPESVFQHIPAILVKSL